MLLALLTTFASERATVRRTIGGETKRKTDRGEIDKKVMKIDL